MAPPQPLDRLQNGKEPTHDAVDRLRNRQRHPVRRIERRGLRQHLGDDKDKKCHRYRGVDHTGIAEESEQQTSRQRRGRDGGKIIAKQNRPQQPLAGGEQPIDDRGVAVALLLKPHHGGAGRCGQCRLARREECRRRQAHHHRKNVQPVENIHFFPSFSSRKVRTSRASTPVSTNAAPIPRTRMNVGIPRFIFLSCAIKSISRSTGGNSPAMSCGRAGRPTTARWRMARSASAAGSKPRRAENSNASAIPAATASPCKSRPEKPVAASNACPKVWPRLSNCRSPISRSSRATIAALARQHIAMACSRAGPPLKTSRQFVSSQEKNA